MDLLIGVSWQTPPPLTHQGAHCGVTTLPCLPSHQQVGRWNWARRDIVVAIPYGPPRGKKNQIRERLLQTDNSQSGWEQDLLPGRDCCSQAGPPEPPALRGEVEKRHPGEGGSRRGVVLLDEELRRDCSQPNQRPRWTESGIRGGVFMGKPLHAFV